MKQELKNQTGIFVAYPISEEKPQSIFKRTKRPDYLTQTSSAHTKIGMSEKNFSSREKCFLKNFGTIEFKPIAVVDKKYLKETKRQIVNAIKLEYDRVGKSYDWFDTKNRKKIIEITKNILSKSEAPYTLVN